MDREDRNSLNRARVTAGWSYLGSLVPIVGLILGAISLSNLGAIDKPDTSKARKRINSVKKLAVGGIVLSILVGLLYGGLTAWNIQASNKQQIRAQQVKANQDEQGCAQQIIGLNNKINTLNTKFPAQYSEQFENLFNTNSSANDCKSGTEAAITKAKSNYDSAMFNAKTRCLKEAQETYTQYLKINETRTSTDANGQIIYYMPQTNWDYVNKVLQQDKDSCNQQYATTN